MNPVRVPLGHRSYDVAFAGTPGGVGEFVRKVLPKASRAVVVTDRHTAGHGHSVAAALREHHFTDSVVTVPAGESSKSLAELGRLYDALAATRADRGTPVVAVGGGVVGDLAGFAAATFNRGLPLVMVPTTLLAMVDSSVGGKTGINHPAGKNLIGAFHQPAGVWVDPAYLETLPPREYRSGLAEVVKYGVILDAQFFHWIEKHAAELLARDPAVVLNAVRRSCELKAQVVSQDEREETGVRAVLNYGHTFAHAFESVAGYGAWLHGEAVAAGMTCAARLAENLGRVPKGFTDRQKKLLEALQLPAEPDPAWPADAVVAAMATDKKATAAGLRFVLPTKLGHVELLAGVAEEQVRGALRP